MTPALAISRFINILLKAMKGETNCVDCAFIRQTGHIGQFIPYMTSIVRLGKNENNLKYTFYKYEREIVLYCKPHLFWELYG